MFLFCKIQDDTLAVFFTVVRSKTSMHASKTYNYTICSKKMPSRICLYIYNIYITYILYIFVCVCVCACVVCLHISEPLACLGPSEARRQRASDLPELVTDGFELPCTHVPLPLVEDPALNHWAISLAFLKHNAPKFHTSLLIPIWKVDPWSHWAKREARKYCSC